MGCWLLSYRWCTTPGSRTCSTWHDCFHNALGSLHVPLVHPPWRHLLMWPLPCVHLTLLHLPMRHLPMLHVGLIHLPMVYLLLWHHPLLQQPLLHLRRLPYP